MRAKHAFRLKSVDAGLGAICAVLAILLMRAVALAEVATRRLRLPGWARPIIGGAL